MKVPIYERCARVFSAPPGKPADWYRDFTLGLIAVPVGIVGVVLAAVGNFNITFWTCAIIYLICLMGADHKSVIVGAPLLFAGVRLLRAFAISGRADVLVLGSVCFAAFFGVLFYPRRAEGAPSEIQPMWNAGELISNGPASD